MDYCAALVVSTPKPPRPEDRVRHETNGKKVMAGSYLSILVDTHTRMGRGGIPALLENPFSGGFMLRLHLRKVPAHAASLGLLPLQEVSYKRVKKHWNPCQASPHPAEGNPCGGFMLRFAGCCTSTFPRTKEVSCYVYTFAKFQCPGKSPLSCYIQRFRKVPTRMLDKWICFRFTGFLSPTLRLEVSCYVYTFAKFQSNMRSGS